MTKPMNHAVRRDDPEHAFEELSLNDTDNSSRWSSIMNVQKIPKVPNQPEARLMHVDQDMNRKNECLSYGSFLWTTATSNKNRSLVNTTKS